MPWCLDGGWAGSSPVPLASRCQARSSSKEYGADPYSLLQCLLSLISFHFCFFPGLFPSFLQRGNISLFFNVQIQWNSGSLLCCVGLRSTRTQEGPTQWAAASHSQSHTHIWSFLKVVCRPRFFSQAESDNIPNCLAFGKEGKIKASFSDNEGPLLSGIFDLCLVRKKLARERSFVLDSKFHFLTNFHLKNMQCLFSSVSI